MKRAHSRAQNLNSPSKEQSTGEAYRPGVLADMMLYTEHGALDALNDSDGDETSKLEDSEGRQQQYMFIWSPRYEKWHECFINFNPPILTVTEFEDEKMEVNEEQLLHLKQRWYHGSISRREAKIILQDFRGGDGTFLVRSSESYSGKFAISFVHEHHVKHVVIETTTDPVSGVLYHVTPYGPRFTSLNRLVEEAQRTPVIQSRAFEIVLGKCPPKPDMRWLHKGVKSLSKAEQVLRKDHREGAFLVYRTKSEHSPFIVAYRSNGSILHNLVIASQRPQQGYTLNGLTVPVLYKLIHYYMENPINGTTVLKYPIEDRDPITTSCAVAVKDHHGDQTDVTTLAFSTGSLITNISPLPSTKGWWCGNHRGDRDLSFPSSHVRLLTKEELDFITHLKSSHRHQLLETQLFPEKLTYHTHSLDLKSDYRVTFDFEGREPTIIHIEPLIKNFRSYRMACPSPEVLEQWYHTLQHARCLPKCTEELGRSVRHRKGCTIC